MSEFTPKKLKVNFKGNVSITEPIIPRKYTLTHSDETAELFLTIGSEYDLDSIDNKVRDEVLAYWQKEDTYSFVVNLKLDVGLGVANIIKRDKIFRQELPLALMAIVFGDNLFLEKNKNLYYAPVIVKFESGVPEYNVTEKWGIVNDYKYTDETRIKDKDGIKPSNKFEGFQPPIPAPPIPIPYFNKKSINDNKKDKICESALIAILNSYIRNEVNIAFGRGIPYCLKDAEILEAKKIDVYGPCSNQYEIAVGLKVGKTLPYYNNFIITFIIDEKNIKVKNVIMPK